MQGITICAAGEIEAYTGPHEIPGVRFRHARKALGVSAWGMNVIELDPQSQGYPDHDHEHEGQEEVYVVLSGAAVLQVADEQWPVRAGDMIRVAPAVKRKWITGEHPVRLLALGGTPGKAYEAAEGM